MSLTGPKYHWGITWLLTNIPYPFADMTVDIDGVLGCQNPHHASR